MNVDKGELLAIVFDRYGLRYPSARGKILCPAHSEDRPSAVVDMVTGKWRCFACHVKGDALDLIQLKEGVSFSEATAIAEGLLNESGGSLRSGTGGQSSAGLFGSTRDKRASRKYVPSWLR
jgi:DNA primase